MADLNDITAVIASALEEVSVSGELDVQMNGKKKMLSLGDKGDDVVVKVVVQPLDKAA